MDKTNTAGSYDFFLILLICIVTFFSASTNITRLTSLMVIELQIIKHFKEF